VIQTWAYGHMLISPGILAMKSQLTPMQAKATMEGRGSWGSRKMDTVRLMTF